MTYLRHEQSKVPASGNLLDLVGAHGIGHAAVARRLLLAR
jgi:hypothetical protein